MKISAVIPAYNAKAVVGRAIESVLAQSRPADEIIVVDDGSTDATADTVRAFGEKVIIIRRENGGASAARNAGIERASGDWIAFLDADDEWTPDRLGLQERFLTERPELKWVTGNYYFQQGDQGRVAAKETGDYAVVQQAGGDLPFYDCFLAGLLGWTGTLLVRRDLLLEAGGFSPGQARYNDIDMWFRCAFLSEQIGVIPEPLGVYHTDIADSITKRHVAAEHMAQMLRRTVPIAKEKGVYAKYEPCVRAMVRNTIHQCLFDKRIYEVRGFAREFSEVLDKRYRRLVWWLTLFPGLSLAMMPVLRKLNRVLGLDV